MPRRTACRRGPLPGGDPPCPRQSRPDGHCSASWASRGAYPGRVMALVRYTALRFLVFAVVVALLWLFWLRGFWLLLAGVLLSGFVSLFALNRSRDELSSAYVQRREKIKQRMADRAAAEDAWNDEARG